MKKEMRDLCTAVDAGLGQMIDTALNWLSLYNSSCTVFFGSS